MKLFFKYLIFILIVCSTILSCSDPSLIGDVNFDSVSSKHTSSVNYSTDGNLFAYGYCYSTWKEDNQGSFNFTMSADKPGQYDFTWNNTSNTVSGIGWNPGTDHTIEYKVYEYSNSGGGGISLYGWTRNPLKEYYVTEKGDFSGTNEGTFSSDGNSYQVKSNWRNNKPSIDGIQTFEQFFSIRQSQPGNLSDGTITIKNHFDKWADYDMDLGTNHYYQIMATEGFGNGSGSSTVRTWEQLPPLVTNTIKLACYNYNYNKVLTARSYSGTPVNVRLTTPSSRSQKQGWQFVKVADMDGGYIVRIRSTYIQNQQYLTATSAASNARVKTDSFKDNDLQLWELIYIQGNTNRIKLINKGSRLFLTGYYSYRSSNASIRDYARYNLTRQLWKIQ